MTPSRLDLAIELLHSADDAALATLSAALHGHPFASQVPFITDERQRPVMLLSGLAEHTRNLAADPRASLMIARKLGDGEVARLSLVGDVRRIGADDLLVARYLRYHPHARLFLQLGDFAFHRFEPHRAMTVGGFAKAAWLQGSRLTDTPMIAPDAESDLVAALAPTVTGEGTLLGVDPCGADLRGEDGRRRRLHFADAPRAPADIAPALQQALAASRHNG